MGALPAGIRTGELLGEYGLHPSHLCNLGVHLPHLTCDGSNVPACGGGFLKRLLEPNANIRLRARSQMLWRSTVLQFVLCLGDEGGSTGEIT